MEDKTFIAGIGILSLALMESIAIFTGQDGAYFMPIVAAISGIVGAVLGIKIPYLYERLNEVPKYPTKKSI